MEDILNLITGLTAKERKKLLSWVASLPEEKTVEIFGDGVKKSYQLKQERPDIPGKINKYSAFIMAARKSGWDTLQGKGYRVAQEKQYEDFSHLRKASVAALIKKGRTPILRRKILAYWGEVKELKNEGNGFRPIADHLKSKHKVKTSATYLARLWKEIETNG
jgi:hypothetical protein